MAFSASPVGSSLLQFSLELSVGGGAAAIPINNATVQYTIVRTPSLLPRAEVSAVVGKSMAGGADADAFNTLRAVKRGDKATLTFSTGGGAGRVIFEGYVNGVSVFRTDSSYGVTVSLVHWLSALAGTAAYYAGLDAMFPESKLRYVASPAAAGTQGQGTAVLTMAAVHNGITPGSNIWDVFHSALRAAQNEAVSSSAGSGANNIGTALVGNSRGFAALARIAGKAVLIQGSSAQVMGAMRETFARLAFSGNMGGRTLLDKLLVFCNMMHVMLLPGATTAAVVPEGSLASCQRGATLTIDEEVLARLLLAKNPEVRGCFMYGAAEGADQGMLGDPGSFPSACYDAGADTDGLMISVNCPPWLSGFVRPSLTFLTTGNGYSGEAAPTDDGGKADRDELKQAIQEMGNRWCKLQWAVESCRGSSSTIEGPLRFDIGPGTQLGLAPGTPDGADGGVQAIGLVEGVEIALDASAAAVSTRYTISGARLVSDARGLQSHPLYGAYIELWPIEA